MDGQYDVIIIGTGAGGGTLAHHLAPSGKRILLLERGDFLPREMENWDPRRRVRRRQVHLRGHLVRPDGKPFQPQVHYFVGGATKLYGAALYRLRPRTSARSARRRHVARLAARLRRSRAVLHQAEWLYQVHGAPRRGSDRRPRLQALPVPGGQPRAAHPGDLRRPRPRTATTRSRAVRHPARRGGHGPTATACGAHGATATRAWSTPRPTPRSSRVRPAPRAPQRHPAGQRRGRPSWRPTRPGRTVTGVVVERDGQTRAVYRRTSWSCRRGAANSAKLLLNSANDKHPNGLANGSDQVGRNYMFHNCKAGRGADQGAERHRLPEDPRHQRLLLRRPRTDVAARATSRWSASPTPMAMKGEKPRSSPARAALGARGGGPPRRRLVADHRGPAHARQPGHRRPRTATSIWPTRRPTTRRPKRLYQELETILTHVGMADHHVLSKNFYMSMNIPVAGVRPPGRDRPVRRRPGHVGARHQLQGPRARQPLRRRHQLLPEHRRGQPGPHRHGQRHPGGRAPAPTAQLTGVVKASREHPGPGSPW